MRRTLLAVVRTAALIIIAVGLSEVLAGVAPQLRPVARVGIAVLVAMAMEAVAGFARPKRASPSAPMEAQPPAEQPEAMFVPDRSEEIESLTAALNRSEEARAEAQSELQRSEEARAEGEAELQRLRAETEAREATLTRDVEELVRVTGTLRQQIVNQQAVANDAISRAEGRLNELNAELQKARAALEEESRQRRIDAENARARETRLHEQYDSESQHLQHAAGRALEEIQQMRAGTDELRKKHEQERIRAESALRELEAVRKNAEQVTREAAEQREARKRLEAQLGDFDNRLAAAMKELDAVRTERERSRQELDGVRGEHQRARQELQEALRRGEEEKAALRTTLERESSAKLQKIVNELAVDHENDLGEAIAAREEARAELRMLSPRLEEAQRELDRLRQSSEQLRQGNEMLTQQLDEERQRFHLEMQSRMEAQRAEIDGEWSAKLQKIVGGIASDHENDIGEAIAAREEARAEARSLHSRLLELQRQLDSARDGRLGLLQRDDEQTQDLHREREARTRLESEVATLKQQLEWGLSVDEKKIRDKFEAEWSEKLQTIVNHLAADHEADVGKAIEEKEAARAEARTLAMRVTKLQQSLENERQALVAAQEKFRLAESEIASMRTAPMAALPDPPPSPPSPPEPTDDEERRARAEVLQFAEQANAVLRRATAPGDVPLPQSQRRPVVLFVHHDPALRNMSKENLSKSGFEVITASDGLEGLRIATSRKPDVVVADVSMPKMGGRELCQLIKSNQETAAVKVVLITGMYTAEQPLDGNLQFEADELLRKPVKFETLKTTLSNLTAQRAAS